MKATGAPGLNAALSVQEPADGLQRIFDAYGPKRFFWGTASPACPAPAPVRDHVHRGLPWLKGRDLEQVMGAVCAKGSAGTQVRLIAKQLKPSKNTTGDAVRVERSATSTTTQPGPSHGGQRTIARPRSAIVLSLVAPWVFVLTLFGPGALNTAAYDGRRVAGCLAFWSVSRRFTWRLDPFNGRGRPSVRTASLDTRRLCWRYSGRRSQSSPSDSMRRLQNNGSVLS